MRPHNNWDGLLQAEHGTINRLVDQYVAYYHYVPTKTRAPHQARVFVPADHIKRTKDMLEPFVIQYHADEVHFQGHRWQADLWFDPVVGQYHLKYRGDGEEAHEVFVALAGIDDGEWGLHRVLLDRAWLDFEANKVFRRIPGISYIKADANKREGPKDVVSNKHVRTSW